MQLHHTTGRPDWMELVKHRYNKWQRVAVRTKGVVTPGNVITIAGFILVICGLIAVTRQQYWASAILIVIGRLLDVADGWVADKTGTKSPLGELLDAGLDKISLVAILVTLPFAGIIPWWVIVVLVIPQIGIALVSFRAVRKHKKIHPSRVGKLSMATANASLIGFIVAEAVGAYGFHPFAVVMYVLAIISVWLGMFALFGYLDQK